jgi:glycosyltransferase involved in cell wall biosynthesis
LIVGFVLLDAQVTGGQIVAHQLMRGLRARGHDAIAVFPHDGPMADAVRLDGVTVVVTPLDDAFRLDQAVRLARSFRAHGIDAVDAHTLFAGNQLVRFASVLARVPLVTHVHIEERLHGRTAIRAAQRLLDRGGLRLTHTFVPVSEALGSWLVSQGVPPNRITVVHNGVELPPLAPPPPRPGLKLVCAARLGAVKGQDVLIRALAAAGEGIHLSLVGEELEPTGFRDRLERLAAELDVADRVAFLGYRDDLPRLLDDADALALPSHAEGLPLVALEAMAHGRAVVATAVGGTPEAVTHEETGLLVAPGDVEALAAALVRLRDDRGLRERYGRAARERAERFFTVERMVEETLAVYEAARGGARRPA